MNNPLFDIAFLGEDEKSVTENINKQDEIKKTIKENFEYLSTMSIPEYTLYRKWLEINSLNWSDSDYNKVKHIKKNIWQPKSIDDYKDLNIKVIWANDKETLLIWRILRLYISSAAWNQNPGRNLRFYVVHEEENVDLFGNKVTNHKYLGVISLGSDFISIGGRDKAINWTMENKMKGGMLKHTAMGSSIVPTQPLGYNYLGGKLISLMVLSDVIENAWNESYNEKLLGVTTTSLYGGFSQYNNLKYWKKCKSSTGEIAMEPSNETYELIKNYCKDYYPDDYASFVRPKNDGDGCSIPSHPKTKIMSKVFKELNIKPPKNNAPRGVYWAPLYTKTNEYLRQESDNHGEKKFDNSVETLSKLWKEKYASKRITKLIEKDNVTNDILFYDELEGEETKKKYLTDVGR